MLRVKDYCVIGVLFSVDQISKWIASQYLTFLYPVSIIPSKVSFILVHNYGAAYGILQHQRFLLLAVSMGVILGCLFFSKTIIQSKWSKWGLIFLLSGALGNMTDRLIFGYVIDFVDIRIFPVFNVADVLIDCAVGCFLWEMFVDRKKVSRK